MADDYQSDSAQEEADVRARALLRRMGAGDEEAAGAFFAMFEATVCRYVRHIMPDISEDDLGDVVQETFLSALRNAANYRGESRVSTWLLRIAHYKSADWLRRQRSWRRFFQPFNREEEHLSDPHAVRAEEEETLPAEVLAVRIALGKLPSEQRQALVLRYVMGLSVEEVAATMQLKHRKVEWLITQGRAALRALLNSERDS